MKLIYLSSPGGGSDSSNTTTSPGGGSGRSPTSEGLSAGKKKQKCFLNKRYGKGGKRLRFSDKPPPAGQTPRDWRDCEHKTLESVKDTHLAEFLIGYNLEFSLPKDYWPKDNGNWKVSCADTHIATKQDKGYTPGALSLTCVFLDGPKLRQIGTTVKIPMSGPHSIRRAISEVLPTAKLVGDLIKPVPLPP